MPLSDQSVCGPLNRRVLDVVIPQAEARVGRLPVVSRCHKLPKRLQDDYELCDTSLGSGMAGVVQLARGRVQPDEQFAVKTYDMTSRQWKYKYRDQLTTELEVYLTMDHPHIARLLDVYETREKLQLVMECMHGGELFDRLQQHKRFDEAVAADATRQMLLALSYVHGRGIAHRDLKLENWLYDKPDSTHLKLIDFGFCAKYEQGQPMRECLGTLAFIAPEVFDSAYTNACDMWSLGVIVFSLASGKMPFFGRNDDSKRDKIISGQYTMKPETWAGVSEHCKAFVRSLLQVDPERRPTAIAALEDCWITSYCPWTPEVDTGVVSSLREFGRVSTFRRHCLHLLAWRLSTEDREKVHRHFLHLDRTKSGTITAVEFRQVMDESFSVPEDELQHMFEALDSSGDGEMCYSDFLAAMVAHRIPLTDDMSVSAFSRFDTDASGSITAINVKDILGADVENDVLQEADLLQDGCMSLPEFSAFVTQTPLELHQHLEARLPKTPKEGPMLLTSRKPRSSAAKKHKVLSPPTNLALECSTFNQKRLDVIEGQPKGCCVMQ